MIAKLYTGNKEGLEALIKIRHRQDQEKCDVTELSFTLLGIDAAHGIREIPTRAGATTHLLVIHFEQISIEAQNALLKTIEDVHDHIELIFVCANPDGLLPTFKSRCLMLIDDNNENSKVERSFVSAGYPDRRAISESIIEADDVGAIYKLIEGIEQDLHVKRGMQVALREVWRTRRLLATREISAKMALEHLLSVVPIMS